METTKIAVFRGKQIRRHWDDNRHSWFFSVADVIAALTNSENPSCLLASIEETPQRRGCRPNRYEM